MSCITGMGDPGDHHRRAQSQSLKFSKPEMTDSKIARLREQAESDDPNIRAIAAGHPEATEGMLLKLAIDPNWYVRAWVVKNPKVSDTILKFLADHDESSTIRVGARYELDRRDGRDDE